MNVREILSGRTLALGIGLALGLATLPAAADMGHNGVLTLRRQDAGLTRVRGYWTPERLRSARPLPLNQVQAADANETDESEAALEVTGSATTPTRSS